MSTLRVPAEPTPHDCYEQIKPSCDALLDLTRRAPLTKAGRAGLSTLVAVHFFAAAIADQRRALGNNAPTSVVARQLMELIVEDLARDEPKSAPSVEPSLDRGASAQESKDFPQ